MTFKKLIRDTEIYVHLEGAEVRHLLKQFINDSILDFSRLNEWIYLKEHEQIILDGSDSYSLSNLMNGFSGEISLFSGKTMYQKTKYENYIQYSSRTRIYAIYGDNLYVDGSDVTLDFLFKSTGYKYITFPIINIEDLIVHIAGDQTTYLRDKLYLTINGSTGNDAKYTIESFTVTGTSPNIQTNIVINLPTADLTIDGNVLIERDNILEFDTDEVPAIIHYPDVIQKMTALKMFKYLDDAESSDREAALLSLKINTLKSHEKRTEKNGVPKVVKR